MRARERMCLYHSPKVCFQVVFATKRGLASSCPAPWRSGWYWAMFWLFASCFFLSMKLLFFTCQSRWNPALSSVLEGKSLPKSYLRARIHGDRCTTNHVLPSIVFWPPCAQGSSYGPPSTHHHILPASLSLLLHSRSSIHSLSLSEQWESPFPVSVRAVNSSSLKVWGPISIDP